MIQNQQARQKRKKQTAEDFTPLKLVNEILDRLSKESNNSVWEEEKTFNDPACGNGNFLIEVLKRKLILGHNPVLALSTIYGADIMKDNILECKLRLLKVIIEHVKKNKLPKPNVLHLIILLKKNIKWVDPEHYKNGSLDYDFAFDDVMTMEEAQKALDWIKKEKLLDQVETW